MDDETLKHLENKRAILIREIEKEKGALKVLLMSSLAELEEQIAQRKRKVEQFQLRSPHGTRH
jgi:deoxyadenosine/deoxycytidine kinase